MLKNILSASGLTPRMQAQLKAAGWTIWSSDELGVDIELKSPLDLTQGSLGDLKPSLCAQFAYDSETNVSSILLGSSGPDGFDPLSSITCCSASLHTQVGEFLRSNSSQEGGFYKLTQQHPVAFERLLNGVQRLSEVLKIGVSSLTRKCSADTLNAL